MITAIDNFYDETIEYQDKHFKRRDTIFKDAQQFAKQLVHFYEAFNSG